MMTTVKADNHHINNIDENMTYRCESCDQIFNSSEQLAYHQIQEHASKQTLLAISTLIERKMKDNNRKKKSNQTL